MSGTELSRVRTEFRLRPPEPINQSHSSRAGPTLLCNHVVLGRFHLSDKRVYQDLGDGTPDHWFRRPAANLYVGDSTCSVSLDRAWFCTVSPATHEYSALTCSRMLSTRSTRDCRFHLRDTIILRDSRKHS
jgi:hypothetical protein